MATIIERNGKYQAIIRKKGHKPVAKTFSSRALAKTWAKGIEADVERGRAGIAEKQMTIGDMMQKFCDEVAPTMKSENFGVNVIQRIVFRDNKHWVDIPANEFDPSYLRDWIDDRLTEVSPPSVLRELAVMAGVFRNAIKRGWVKLPISPTRLVLAPGNSRPRTRTLTEGELISIVGPVPDYAPVTSRDKSAYAAWFSFETALRLSEITQLTWSDIDAENLTVWVRDEWSPTKKSAKSVKNNHTRQVPLTVRACRLINSLSEFDKEAPMSASFLNLTSKTLDTAWSAMRKAAGLEGQVVFHDLRRSALTSLAKKYKLEELAKISGHESLDVLFKTYYQPSGRDLAERLHEAPAPAPAPQPPAAPELRLVA